MAERNVRKTTPTALNKLVERLGQAETAERIGVSPAGLYSALRDDEGVRVYMELAARWVLSTLPGGENAGKPVNGKYRFHLLVQDAQLPSTLTFCSAMGAGVQRFLLDFKSAEVDYHFLIVSTVKEKVEVFEAFFGALEIERGKLVE